MKKDEVVPDGKWIFDKEVTEVFEDMLSRSIPQYDVMRDAVYNLGSKILENHKPKVVLDIGCSDGLSLQKFVNKYGAHARIKGIDISEPMINKAKKRYEGYISCGVVSIDRLDLRKDFPLDKYNLIMSIFTIQFIPIEYRQEIIQKCYDNLVENGAFIFVEKVLGNCSQLNEIMVDEYLKMKRDHGYTQDQIDRKRLSLEGVLVPMTSDWNKDMLRQAGFKKIDSFWRWMNFEGYIAIK